MAFYSKLKQKIKDVVLGAADIAMGVLLYIPIIGGYSYTLIQILFIGLAFIITRGVFLAIIPFVLRHTDVFVDIVNVVIVFFDIFIDLVILIVDVITNVIHDIADVINDASRLLGGHKIVPVIPALDMKFTKVYTISKHAFKAFLINVETNCPAYNSAGRIFYFITRNIFNSFSCPLVRYTWPVKWIYTTMEALLSWSYYGSAAPLVDTADANCIGGDFGTSDYVCVGLGVGFFIVEVLIPMIFIFVLLLLIGKGLAKFFQILFFLFFLFIETSENLVLNLINSIENIAQDTTESI